MKVFLIQVSLALVSVFSFATQELTTQSTSSSQARTPHESAELKEAVRMESQARKLAGEQRYDEAVAAALRSLEIRERILTAGDQELLRSLTLSANLYQATGEYEKADTLYRQVLATVDASQPLTKESINLIGRYACLMRKTHRSSDAEPLEMRAYGLRLGDANDKIESTAKPPFKEVRNGTVIDLPQPGYPRMAKPARISGTTYVRVIIDESGQTIAACAVKGDPLFGEISEQAAYRAKFRQTLVDNSAVKVSGVITYKFVAN